MYYNLIITLAEYLNWIKSVNVCSEDDYQSSLSMLVFSCQGCNDSHDVATLMEAGAKQSVQHLTHEWALEPHTYGYICNKGTNNSSSSRYDF